MTTERDRAVAALEAVIEETRSLFHRLRRAAEEIHHQGELTAGRRGVLRDLARLGPRTVPQLARRRPVSRQHIQMLVNPLAAEGLVELADNPAHRRSRQVRLTPRGKALVEAMQSREREVLEGRVDALAAAGEGAVNLESAARTLAAVRRVLEDPRWKAGLGGPTQRGDRS